jgi:preprotein translocase subunit SecA
MKEGIGLRGYGQKDPLQEYKREGYDMFMSMSGVFKTDVVERMFRIQIRREEEVERMEQRRKKQAALHLGVGGDSKAQTVKRQSDKVGRNDPCPCGSGLKYKKCCGK